MEDSSESREILGCIVEVRASGLYAVLLDSGERIVAGLSGAGRHSVSKLITGDRVKVRTSRFDPNRGQITGRY